MSTMSVSNQHYTNILSNALQQDKEIKSSVKKERKKEMTVSTYIWHGYVDRKNQKKIHINY